MLTHFSRTGGGRNEVKGGDSFNFYFAPKNKPKSTPESMPRVLLKMDLFSSQDYPDSVNSFFVPPKVKI